MQGSQPCSLRQLPTSNLHLGSFMDCGSGGKPPPPPLPTLSDPAPPDIHFRLLVQQYVVVACLTLCVWDWLLVIADELEMIRRIQNLAGYLLHGLYLITRAFSIIYLAVAIVLNTLSDKNACKAFARVIAATNVAIVPAVSGLFFVRLSAVYARSKYITTFFGLCWLAVFGIFIHDTTTILSRFANEGDTFRCYSVKPADGWAYTATAVYDTLMYVAISWRLASFGMSNHWKSRIKYFVTGSELSRLSKVLLRSGQAYYFLTVGFTICNAVFIIRPDMPPEWRSLFLEPNIAVASIMACRLVRELKLGVLDDEMDEHAVSKIVFRDLGIISQQESGGASELHTYDDGTGTNASEAGAQDIENLALKDMVRRENV